MQDQLKKAIEILRDGGIVIFPTDTAYGIGCRLDDERAVRRLFKIRKRPITQATPVLVDSIEMAKRYLEIIPYDVEEKLIKPYWPGKLTIILDCIIVKVPSLVRGGGQTLGVRLPNHELITKIIQELGVPLLGPSANFHKETTPFKFKDLDPKLVRLADYVLEYDSNSDKTVSTVIDCSSVPWKIVRQGAVKIWLY